MQKKRPKIIFQKKHAKKGINAKKKYAKNVGGVYIYLQRYGNFWLAPKTRQKLQDYFYTTYAILR